MVFASVCFSKGGAYKTESGESPGAQGTVKLRIHKERKEISQIRAEAIQSARALNRCAVGGA